MTTSHPAVGFIYFDSELAPTSPSPQDPDGCRGVLISPQYALTSADCIRFHYASPVTPPLAPPASPRPPSCGGDPSGYLPPIDPPRYGTDVLVLVDASGTRHEFTIDGVHVFGTRPQERTPSGRFTTDLALVRLRSAVPSSVATPLAMADRDPAPGALSTMFGGQLDTRFRSFNVGGGGGAQQRFDKGGPVIYGAANGGGAVWGVNSGITYAPLDSPTPFASIDTFASVPQYRKQIEDLMRQWSGAAEVGSNRYGADYDSSITASAELCAVACQADARCRAYSWVPGSNQCWRKDAASEGTPAPGLVSGLPTVSELGVNRWGGDYRPFVPGAPRAELCAAACGREARCRAWTYVAGDCNGNPNGTCWLKDSVPGTSACATCASGVVSRWAEVGYNRPGADVAWSSTTSAAACADQCKRDWRCAAFTYTGAAGTNCWLKDSVPGLVAGTGMTSGVRRGLEVGVDRPGMDYDTFTDSRLTPTVCQARCAQEAACQAWSYVMPTPPESVATCRLKSGVPGKVANRSSVSGIKGLEFLP